MVTLVTILQVNLVMSILLYVMVLTYLYTIQATNMDSSFQGQQQQPSPDPLNSLIIKLLQADLTRGRTGGSSRGAGSRTAAESISESSRDALLLPSLGMMSAGSLMSFEEQQTDPEEARGGAGEAHRPAAAAVTMLNSDLLRQHKRYNSPRVLLSDRPPLQPPPLYLMDDFVSAAEGGGVGGGGAGGSGNKTRKKRYAGEHKSYRGEYSVCDSESEWVTDKTQATDLKGQRVTVLRQIRSSSNMQEAKQYFYETRCRTEPFKSSCRGIDDKHWNSQCKTVQTYVRALTQVRSAVGWRWIRIDTSCVCALSRKHRRT